MRKTKEQIKAEAMRNCNDVIVSYIQALNNLPKIETGLSVSSITQLLNNMSITIKENIELIETK